MLNAYMDIEKVSTSDQPEVALITMRVQFALDHIKVEPLRILGLL
jgi:hypothetical protein